MFTTGVGVKNQDAIALWLKKYISAETIDFGKRFTFHLL